MDIMLIPGSWLDGSSWADVKPALERAGHRVRALTLPSLKSADADRDGIRLRDHVDAVAAVDEASGPVVLVGHSGETRSHTGPPTQDPTGSRGLHTSTPGRFGDGWAINDELPVLDGEILAAVDRG